MTNPINLLNNIKQYYANINENNMNLIDTNYVYANNSDYIKMTITLITISYFITGLVAIILFIKKLIKKVRIKIAYGFYLGLVFALMSRSITFLIILLSSKKEYSAKYSNGVLYFMFVVPDMLNCCVYILLIWIFFNTFIVSHIYLARDIGILCNNEDSRQYSNSLQNKTNLILYIIISIYISLYLTLSMLTIYSALLENILPIINSIINIATPIMCFTYYMYLLFKYSGSPYNSKLSKKQTLKLYAVVIIWTIARVISGILCLINSTFYINIAIREIYNINNSNFVTSLVLFLYCLITEFLPYLIAMSTQIVYQYLLTKIDNKTGIFFNKKMEFFVNKDKEEIILDEEVKTLENKYPSTLDDNFTDNPKKFNNINDNCIVIIQDFVIKEKDFDITTVISPKKKHSFGIITNAVHGDIGCVVRCIEFDRLSRYNLEEFSEDVDEIINLNNHFITRVKGICLEKSPKLYILYFKTGISLEAFLHNNSINKNSDSSNEGKKKLNKKDKLEFCIKIALGLKYLHDMNIPHLHLSNRNILIDKNNNPKITDYGFNKTKNLAEIFLNYRNKNSYSSPEILQLNSNLGQGLRNSLIKSYNIEINKKFKTSENNSCMNNNEFNDQIKENKESFISNADLCYSLRFDDDLKDKKSTNYICKNIDSLLYKSDIYSLGLIFWEIFSEIKPFDISLKEVYNLVVEQALRPSFDESIPEVIAKIISKCWCKDPYSRYDIDKVIEELRSIVF